MPADGKKPRFDLCSLSEYAFGWRATLLLGRRKVKKGRVNCPGNAREREEWSLILESVAATGSLSSIFSLLSSSFRMCSREESQRNGNNTFPIKGF